MNEWMLASQPERRKEFWKWKESCLTGKVQDPLPLASHPASYLPSFQNWDYFKVTWEETVLPLGGRQQGGKGRDVCSVATSVES